MTTTDKDINSKDLLASQNKAVKFTFQKNNMKELLESMRQCSELCYNDLDRNNKNEAYRLISQKFHSVTLPFNDSLQLSNACGNMLISNIEKIDTYKYEYLKKGEGTNGIDAIDYVFYFVDSEQVVLITGFINK